MNRNILLAGLIVGAVLLVGCAPSVVVENKTGFAVRVVVHSAGRSEVVSPSPGESSVAEVVDWIEWAKLTRKVLNDQLTNSDQLTGPQLLEVVRRLKDIAARMQQYESAGIGASCSGAVSSDGGDGSVVISTAANGALVATCR